MNALTPLRFFRKKRKINQADMLPHRNTKAYQRLEYGETEISFNDLLVCLNSLQLTPEEYFNMIEIEKNMPILEIEKQLKKCTQNPNNINEKNKLIDHYKKLKSIETKNSMEMALYNDIKSYFSTLWHEIEPINNKDIDNMLKIIKKNSYYTYYDYRMIVNTIILFSKEDTNFIYKKMFPIEDIENRTFRTLYVAYLFYPNRITRAIYDADFNTANKLIQLAEQENVSPNNYYFHQKMKYLKNLVLYLTTKENIYYAKILEVILFFEECKNFELAEDLKQETDNLANGYKYSIEDGNIVQIFNLLPK
ncbi:hypothetical protein NGC25_10730 [Enterococcus faecalis]|uniref:hypothetical protein n=1 Tax=Enterococcus faecalis TaxID=1351 RepID=UPI002DBC6B71|nr:hypothetical protein [Enterococcus faecalis]MEB7427752.1 hypothetical protein [Enterococcus faecalis]